MTYLFIYFYAVLKKSTILKIYFQETQVNVSDHHGNDTVSHTGRRSLKNFPSVQLPGRDTSV